MRVMCFMLAAACALAGTQPVPFSHKLHAAQSLKCQDCHPNPDPGRAMTLPAASKCMACHASIAADRPAIQKLAELARSGHPIAWVRVNTLPDFAVWSHRTHLKSGIQCADCHGDVAHMDTIAVAANVTKMAGCLECHRQKKATVECDSCHDLN